MDNSSSAYLVYLYLKRERKDEEACSSFIEDIKAIAENHLWPYCCKQRADEVAPTKAPEKLNCFLIEASSFLGVNESQCLDLFINCLWLTMPCSSTGLQNILSDERNRRFLTLQLYSFYLVDRIYVLKILTSLVKMRISDAVIPDDSMRVCKPDYLKSVIRAYVDCVKSSLSSKSDDYNLEQLCHSAECNFYFQRELVRFLIWHIHACDFPLSLIFDILDVLQVHHSKQSRPEWDKEIGLLEIVLYMKIFDIDLLVKEIEASSKSSHSVWTSSSEKEIEALEDAIESRIISGDELRCGPLRLFWCLNKQMRTLDATVDEKIAKLGILARKHRVFATLVNLVESDSIRSDEDLWNITCASLISVIDSFLLFYDPKLTGENDSFNALLRRLVENPFVAEQFWSRHISHNKNNALSYLSQSMLERFPLSFDASLSVAVALCRSSTKSCDAFVDWFQKLSTFCEKINCMSLLNNVHVIDEFTCESLVDRRFPNYGDFFVPCGCIGRIVELTGDDIVIGWCVPCNGWQLLLLKMESDERQEVVDVQRYIPIFELIEAVLKSDSRNCASLVHFLRKAVALLKTSFNFDEKGKVRLLTLCMSALSYCDSSYSYEIFNELCDTLLDSSTLSLSSFASDRSGGLLSRFLNQVDRHSGTYDFTQAFLRLMLRCAQDETARSDERFAEYVSYIINYVFVNYRLWNFRDQNSKTRFAISCLKVMHKAVESMTLKRNFQFTKVPLASEICCRSLLYGEAKNCLTSIIVEASSILNDLLSSLENERAAFDLVHQTSLAISILVQLLDVSLFTSLADKVETKSGQRSLQLPPLLLSLYTKDNKANEAFLLSLTSLSNNRLTYRLPKLALLCLLKYAELFPSSLLYGLGSHVDIFCDIFLLRLEPCPQEACFDADVELQISCIDFLTTCARFQSGLLQKLTSLEKEDLDFRSSLKIRSVDPYSVVFDVVQSGCVHPNLLLACVRFLTISLKCGTDWPEKVASNPQFWASLCAPLACGESEFFLKICCQIFDLLAAILMATKCDWLKKVEPEIRLVVEKTFKNNGESTNSGRLELFYKKFGELFDSDLDLIEDKLDTFEKWIRFLTACVKLGNGEWLGVNACFDIVERTVDLHIKMVESSTYKECSQASGCIGNLYLLFVDSCSKWYPKSESWLRITAAASQLVSVISQVDIGRNFENVLRAPYSIWTMSLLHANTDNFAHEAHIHDSLDSTVILLTKFLTRDSVMFTSEKETADSVQRIILLLLISVSTCISKMNDDAWLLVIKRQFLLPNVVQFLKFQLEQCSLSTDLLTTALGLFTGVVVSAEAVACVRLSGLLEFICGRLPEVLSIEESVLSSVEMSNWQIVFTSLLDFYASTCFHVQGTMVLELPKFQMAWEEYFVKVAEKSFNKPTVNSSRCLLKICLLLRNIALHQDQLRFKFSRSLVFVVDYVSTICAKSIKQLIRPRLVDSSLLNVGRNKESTTDDATLKQELKRINSEVLGVGLQILIEFSPQLKSMLNLVAFDYEAHKCICLPDFSTVIHPEDTKRLTFGHLLLCIQLCTTSLRKPDARISSPSARVSSSHPLLAQQVDKRESFHLLESAAYLCLTQGVLLINQLQDCDFARSVAFKRELATELGLALSKCGRHSGSPGLQRRSPAANVESKRTPGSSSPVTAAFLGFDMNFLLSLREFVDSMLRVS